MLGKEPRGQRTACNLLEGNSFEKRARVLERGAVSYELGTPAISSKGTPSKNEPFPWTNTTKRGAYLGGGRFSLVQLTEERHLSSAIILQVDGVKSHQECDSLPSDPLISPQSSCLSDLSICFLRINLPFIVR